MSLLDEIKVTATWVLLLSGWLFSPVCSDGENKKTKKKTQKTKTTDPRQAQHSSMNTVSTKPVRHHFGKVSTEEVRQGLSNGGWARASRREWLPPPSWVALCWFWEKCKSFERWPHHPPEVGAGMLEVSMCIPKPWGREGKAREVPAPPRAEDGVLVHSTGRGDPGPSGRRVCGTVRMDNWKPRLNSCGSHFHQRIDSDHEWEGVRVGWKGRRRRQIFKIRESEREKLNLILKGVISSPKETNSHRTQCLQKRNLIHF